MDTCAKCGAGLGVGRFCLNCGHRIGAPVPPPPAAVPPAVPSPAPAPSPGPAADPAGLPAATRTGRPTDSGRVPRRGAAPVDDDPDDLEQEPERATPWLPGEIEGDDPPPRLHWGAWVLGAMALVCAALLALSLLGGDTTATDDPGAARPAGETTDGVTDEPTDEPTDEAPDDATSEPAGEPSGPVADVARDATVSVPTTAPPTTDLDGELVSYDAERMVDGDPATAWRMPGDGTGATITLTLAQPAVLDRVGLVNGYAKRIGGVDWYPHNRRILEVRWTFEDGTSVEQTLVERPRVQRLEIEPVTTSTVTLTVLAVTPPGPGGLGRDYTPISTVELTGRPAG